MHLTAPNVDEEEKVPKDFGFFYKERFYLKDKEEIKEISKTFQVFTENKRMNDKSTSKVPEEEKKGEFKPQINKKSAKIGAREGKAEERLQK